MTRSFDPSVYLVTDARLCAPFGLVETVRAAVAGGVTMVQLRDKNATDTQLSARAKALRLVLRPLGVPLIINDRVCVAVAEDADGVHLGQGDLPVADARATLGPDKIIGLSAPSLLAASAVDASVVDYCGIGAVFQTSTKAKSDAPLGVEGFAKLRAVVQTPVVAIGGIGPEGAEEVVAAGADGVAVVSAICGQPDPKAAARTVAAAVKRGKQRWLTSVA